MMLERKFAQGETSVRLEEDARIAGYASWFGEPIVTVWRVFQPRGAG